MNGGDAATVPAIVLGSEARRLRRALGPTAWAVLEELLTEATDDGVAIAHTNRGRIAAELGIGVDAVSSALHRLRDADLVAPVQSVDEQGRFSTGSYRIAVPAEILCLSPWPDEPSTVEPSPVPAPKARWRQPPTAIEQPGLFDTSLAHQTDATAIPTERSDCADPIAPEPAHPTTR